MLFMAFIYVLLDGYFLYWESVSEVSSYQMEELETINFQQPHLLFYTDIAHENATSYFSEIIT